jgi:hypothetical protein
MAIAYGFIKMAIKHVALIGLVIPAALTFVLIGLGSGFSLTEVSRWLVQSQVSVQQLGSATTPDHLLVTRCTTTERQPLLPTPSLDVLCGDPVVKEVSIQDEIDATRKTLGMMYLYLVLSAGMLVLIFNADTTRLNHKAARYAYAVITGGSAKDSVIGSAKDSSKG